MGETAYKLKKPVDLGFLDFREPAVRRQVCGRELELNRRLAPDVYVGLADLPVADGSTEPAVVMRRMPDDRRLATLARQGQDVSEEVRRIARVMAAFHARADRGAEIAAEGSTPALRSRWRHNLEEVARFRDTLLDGALVDEVERLSGRYLDGREALFDERIRTGRVVDGHGDLLADDIFCLPDGPRILDCLEFDDRLRFLDGLDDIACLAMDLERLGASEAAVELMAAYREFSADTFPDSLVHHYIAYRAFMRAKVTALRTEQAQAKQRVADEAAEAVRLAELARDHLRRGEVRLIAVGGAPGTGKSTLTGAVADRLHAVVLSSDRLRKELAGIDPLVHAAAGWQEGIYSRAWTRRTYAELLDRAMALLARGESVVLDASWTDPGHRALAEHVANATYSELTVLRCRVAPEVAVARIAARDSISDADEMVATHMSRAETAWPGAVTIDTGGTVAAVGAGVTHRAIGDRVAIAWLGHACGRCDHCISGWETLCEEQQNSGYSVDGAFAEYAVADADYVVAVPEAVSSFDAAPLTCAGVTTYKAIKVAHVTPGERVAIFGIGGLGHLAVQYARLVGAEVIAVDLTEEKLELARELGADHTVNAATTDPVQAIADLGGADVAVALAATPAAFEQAFASLRRGGRLVCVGLPPEIEGPMRLPIFQTVLFGISVIGSIVGTREDLAEVFRLHALGRTRVIAESRKLEEVNESIDDVLHARTAARLVFEL